MGILFSFGDRRTVSGCWRPALWQAHPSALHLELRRLFAKLGLKMGCGMAALMSNVRPESQDPGGHAGPELFSWILQQLY